MDDDGVFTYDSSLPSARDRIRFSVGDTDAAAPFRWDETLDAVLEQLGDETAATAFVARSMAAELSLEPSSAQLPGGLGVTYGERVKTLLSIADTFQAAYATVAGEASDVRLVRDFETDNPEYRRPLDYAPEGSW